MYWNFKLPVEIEFGVGIVDKISSILEKQNLNNGIIISSPFSIRNGLAKKIMESSGGRITHIYSKIVPNPTIENVDECAKVIKENNIAFAISLGGGSPLDCAKAACSLCKTDDSITEYMYGRKIFTNTCIPLIAIPTTAGTGSEVTNVAVISDPVANKKLPIVSNNFYPKLAIVDPKLTVSVPRQVTASTGLDVLSQALEGYWSKNHQPICDAAAISAAKLVMDSLEKAYMDGENIDARTKMCEASLLAGIAFSIPKTSGPHVCSYPLTSIYNVPHGEACALTLDKFLLINADAENGRLHNFARAIGLQDAYELADHILQLKRNLGMRTTITEIGIKETEIEELVKLCKHNNLKLNPVPITDELLTEMFKSLV